MTNIIDLAAYRQSIADLDGYCSLIAEQYETEYSELPADDDVSESPNATNLSSSFPG